MSGHITARLNCDKNIPVGAGVMDCPIHNSARKQAPSDKVSQAIVKDDGTFAIVRMVNNVSVIRELAMDRNPKASGRR